MPPLTATFSRWFYAVAWSMAICLVCANSWAYSNRVSKFADAYFEPHTADVSVSSIDKLKHFVRTIELSKAEVVIVVGHASKEERNPKSLSEKRAIAVARYLVNSGVAPSRIHFEGKSNSQPVSQSSVEMHRDRRVEIEFIGLPQQDLRLHGFGFMLDWSGAILIPSAHEKGAHFQYHKTPLQYAQQIKNKELQQLFLLKLSLYYLFKKDETNLLSVAPLLNLCGSEVDGLPNPYLYAVLWGSAATQQALQHCNSPIKLTQEQRIDVFRRMFCLEIGKHNQIDFDAVAEALFGADSLPTDIDEKAAGKLFTCSMNANRTKWLISKGVKLPVEPLEGWSLLSMAAYRSDLELVRVLIDAGADPRARTANGDTVLHYVGGGARVRTSIGAIFPAPLKVQQEIWNFLLSHGADRDALNNRNQKPTAPKNP